MKLNSINNQYNRQNFRGSLAQTLGEAVAKHPKLMAGIAGLAGSSVVGQKFVMSGSEATIGPVMDIAIGKTITKITNEKDGRTNSSSKTQAIRTSAQAIGGTITGVIIRGACIAASTALLAKAGKDVGNKIATTLLDNGKIKPENTYEFTEHMAKWGKNVGGAVAIGVMMFTNFIIDAPFINQINKGMTYVVNKISSKKQENQKEVK